MRVLAILQFDRFPHVRATFSFVLPLSVLGPTESEQRVRLSRGYFCCIKIILLRFCVFTLVVVTLSNFDLERARLVTLVQRAQITSKRFVILFSPAWKFVMSPIDVALNLIKFCYFEPFVNFLNVLKMLLGFIK